MKKLIVATGLLMGFSNAKAQFREKEVAYLPDENATYFMDHIVGSFNSDGNEVYSFEGEVTRVAGNHIRLIPLINPNLKPVIKRDRHRKVINTPKHHVECVLGGDICIIIFHFEDNTTIQ
jgi:hypothetical protein